MTLSVFEQMLMIGSPIIMHYKNDLLVHDKNALARMQSGDIAFWMPYDCGTHIIIVPAHDSRALQQSKNGLDAVEKMKPGHQWYKIADGQVTPTTYHEAVKVIRERMYGSSQQAV